MKNEIHVIVNGKETVAAKDTTLSEITKGEKPCGGHGKCGKCKVIAKGNLSNPCDMELKLLSSDEISRGVRLACLTRALGDCEIETVFAVERSQIVTAGILPTFELKPLFSDYGIAIDIGTTTIAAQLYDANGALLSEVSRLNPQQKWGADVMSRIESALNGAAASLKEAIRNTLNDMILEFSSVTDIKKADGVVITGNTVMLSLLTGQSVEPFSHAPFEMKRPFGETLTADELSLSALHPNTPVYLPPCISAFVGADITCALLATELCENNTALLTDIGTNGEMALWHNGKLTVCSTAAGPAFEGVGISMGMRGAVGAIDRVYVENGNLKAHVVGEGTPVGICGSGLVDAVGCMLDLGIIDERGYLEDDEFVVETPVYLTPKDIRMLQLAKSAICAGILTLVDAAKLNTSDISRFYVAGGFGNYLNKENNAKIGLLPTDLSEKIEVVGNAALSGAVMLLLNSEMHGTITDIAKAATTLVLSTNPNFAERYMSGMMLEHT